MPDLSKLHSEYKRLQKLKEDGQGEWNKSIGQIVDIYNLFYDKIDFTKIPLQQLFNNFTVEQRDNFINAYLTRIKNQA